MKNNPTVRNVLRTSHEVKALPRLIAEWNMNRYASPSVANTLAEEDWAKDPDLFPMDSIVEPVRPSSKGILKAMVGQGAISDPYWTPSVPRFYLGSEDDKYKYWVSPLTSDAQGNINGCFPHVRYNRIVQANKIVVHVENSWGTPARMQIDYADGNTWIPVATNPAIPPSGRIELYHHGNNVWRADRPAAPVAVGLSEIRVNITLLGRGIAPSGYPTIVRTPWGEVIPTGAGTHASIIEISARLEVDLTDRVISVSDTQDSGEADSVNPVGTLSSNVADIKLWNGDNVFSENSASTINGISFARLVEPNVEMRLSYVYNDTQVVQQFRMYVDSWEPSDDSTIDVRLSDGSKYLKEIKPNPAKYEDLTFAQIVYRICDAVGFTDYNITDQATRAIDYKIPVFWTDGEKTVWEIFDELSTATQSIIYFDEYGKMNVKTREDAFWAARPVDWVLRGTKSGNELPDIVSLNKETEYEANVVKVIYKTAKWAEEVNGFVKHSTVWEPEGTVVLRSSPLASTMSATDMYLYLGGAEAAIWPFEGYCTIDGEIIKYRAKSFWYFANGIWNNAHVSSQDEYDALNKLTPSNRRHLNYFDGHLVIEERGAWDTVPEAHATGTEKYAVRRAGTGNNVVWSRAGFDYNRWHSTVTLKSEGRLQDQDYLLVTHGQNQDTPWRHFGTKFMIADDRPGGSRCGLVFNNWEGRDGYYVELASSASITEKEDRKELTVYSIHANNRQNPINGAKGTAVSIIAGRWHTLDVYFDLGSHRIKVYIDGVLYANHVMPGNMRHTPNGKFGMFVRGNSAAQFDYLYAIARNDAPEPNDEFSSFHRLTGMNVGRTKDDWVYKQRNGKRKIRRKGKKTKTFKRWKKNQQFMDEFGPYVHEIREFEVKFDPAPVAYSFIYNANDWDSYVLDYVADSFGANFAIANTARSHATLNGEDATYATGTNGSVNPILLVYGRALIFEEEEDVTVEDEARKRARGEIVTEISSDWIQSKAAAKAVADWVAKHWSGPTDQLSVEVFGNTLFQIGDMVAVDYAPDNMNPSTHIYFVTGISTSFDAGLSTSLTLRRRN